MSSQQPDRLEFWSNKWSDPVKPGWHMEQINPNLKKYYKDWLESKKNVTIFVPLCGKSLDLKWLYDQGHSVIGLDGVQSAVINFFNDNGLGYQEQPMPDVEGKIFQTEDQRLKIICCDIFSVPSHYISSVEAVWDRGSFVAIDKGDRIKYGKLMMDLQKPGIRYLMATIQHDDNKFKGPPRHTPTEVVQECFGERYNLEILHESDRLDPNRGWAVEWLKETLLFLNDKRQP